VHHQEVGGEGHQFPVAVHGGHVGRGNDAGQRGEGQQQEEPVPALPVGVGHVAQGVHRDDEGDEADHHQEEQGHGRGRIQRQGRGQGGGTGQHAKVGHPAEFRPGGHAADEGAGKVDPEGGMHGGVGHLQAGPAGGHVQHGAAGQAHKRHQHAQHQGQGVGTAAAGGSAVTGGATGLQEALAQGVHMQGDEDRGRDGRQHGAEQAAVQGQGRGQYALGDKKTPFRDQEGRTAHAGHEAEGEQDTIDGLEFDGPAQGREGRRRSGGPGQGIEGAPAQAAGQQLEGHEQPDACTGGGIGRTQRHADEARVMHGPPQDEPAGVLPLADRLPCAVQQEQQARDEKDEGTACRVGWYCHTRPIVCRVKSTKLLQRTWMRVICPCLPFRRDILVKKIFFHD